MKQKNLKSRIVKTRYTAITSAVLCVLGGAMYVGSVNAETFSYDATPSTPTFDGVTVNAYNSGTTSADRSSSSTSDSVVFSVGARLGTNYYSGVSAGNDTSMGGSVGNGDFLNGGDKFYYATNTPVTNFSINFLTGAAADKVSRTSTTYAGYVVDQSSHGGLTTSPVAYSAIVNFAGGNNIQGRIGGNGGEDGAIIDTVNINGSGRVTVGGLARVTNINFTVGGDDTSLALNGGWIGSNLDFHGNNGTVTLAANQTITGNIDGNNDTIPGAQGAGTLSFGGGNNTVTGTIGATHALNKISIDGVTTGEDSIEITRLAKAQRLDFNANATIILNGLDTTSNHVNGGIHFNGHNSTAAFDSGDLTVVSGTSAASTDNNNTGTLILNATSEGGPVTQTVNGTVGSADFKLAQVGGGGTGATSIFSNEVYSTLLTVGETGTVTLSKGWSGTTANFADGNGTLNVDQNGINGAVTTTTNNTGDLQVRAATQTVTGAVGTTSKALRNVYAGDASTTTTFSQSVYASTLNVNGTGTINLNASGEDSRAYASSDGTTVSQGVISYGTNAGTVVVAAGKTVNASVISTANNGALTFNGGSTLSGDVGTWSGATATANTGLATLNVGETTQGTVNAQGNILATTVALKTDSTLTVASGKNITGNVTAGTASNGILTLSGGTQNVVGNIGASGTALRTINAGATGATTSLNGSSVNSNMTHAGTLNYTGNGTVVLNGTNSSNAIGGLIGTADFNSGTGILRVGDGVKLTTGSTGIQFADANTATLTFDGSSTVTGVLGGNTEGRSTLATINAGATGKTVTFANDVYVSASTFHVTGTGVVNFAGDLNGPLVFDTGATGTVNFAGGKSIVVGSGAAATAATASQGTINFQGATTLSGDLGLVGTRLNAVNFHGTTDPTNNPVVTGSVTQDIGKNVYANTTTIGNATQATIGNLTSNVFLGNAVTLAAGGSASTSVTTLNTAGAMAVSGSTVTFTNTANANGSLTSTAPVTKANFGTGAFTTNGGTLNFVVATDAWASNAGGTISSANSSSFSGGSNSTLVMNSSEKVNLGLLGSLRNGQTYTLVSAVTHTDNNVAGTVVDNSFAIDTALSRAGGSGNLILTASRNANTYVSKSATTGDISNTAAIRLATLGAAGTGYSADLQTVLNKLDIDQWGFGNNQANLAKQVKRLAPVANASLTQSTLGTSGLTLDIIGNRLSGIRGDSIVPGAVDGRNNDVWGKVFGGWSKQNSTPSYDGYKSNVYGLAFGTDHRLDRDARTVVGAGFTYAQTNVSQQDFRAGDSTDIKSYQLTAYLTHNISEKLYVDGIASYSHSQYDGHRLTAIDRTANASFGGNQYTGKLSLGYRIANANKNASLTPLASIEFGQLKTSSYTETGADSLNLNVDSQSINRTRFGLGAKYNAEIAGVRASYRPEFSAMWYHDSGTLSRNVTSSLVGDNSATKFVTPGAEVSRNTYSIGAGVTRSVGKNSSLQLKYDLDIRTGYTGHNAQVVGRWAF